MHVAVIGDINIDVMVTVDALPGEGEEVFAAHSRIGLGGSGANTAVVLARLGLEVEIAARVGEDALGATALTALRETGVDVAGIESTAMETTGLNLVFVTQEDRSMVGARGANPGTTRHPPRGDWLHVSGYALIAEPQRNTVRETMDLAPAISIDVPAGVGELIRPHLDGVLGACRLISGSRQALSDLTGATDPVAHLLSRGTTRVAVTAGAGPCHLASRLSSASVTPPSVDVVDPTGAGDSFMAGLIAADLAGLELGPSLVVASALGADAVTRPGAGTALGDRRAASRLTGSMTGTPPDWIRSAVTLLR